MRSGEPGDHLVALILVESAAAGFFKDVDYKLASYAPSITFSAAIQLRSQLR